MKNYETKMEDMESAHRVELKVYMQKVKHLEYEHMADKDDVDDGAVKAMKTELQYHTSGERDMRG